MNFKEFLKAMQTIEDDRKITKEIVIAALQEALAKAYRKHIDIPDVLVRVDINEANGQIHVYQQYTVVEEVEDEELEVALADVKDKGYQLGDLVDHEVDISQIGRAAALLASPSPLADVYKEFADRETSYMDVVRDSIEQRAEAALDTQRELPLYRHDAAYAREQGDLDLYRASRRANIACKEAIEASISEHYRDNRLDKDAVPQVIERFGYTRTLYVLANTVQQKEWDGRFSPANRAWAKTVDIPPNPDGFGGERNLDFVVDSHPGLVDLFLTQVRQDYLRLQPLTPEEIHAEAARLLQELRAPDAPNSPHGTHYMARVSPDFLARAGTQAHDQLMALLPFRSLAITGLVDRPGTYVTILASEDRSKELRQPRSSVREHLKQEPKQAAPKAPAHKKREPER